MDISDLKIAYFLWCTGLSGGAKILFDHVRHLSKRGFKAEAVSLSDIEGWYGYPIPFKKVRDIGELNSYDLIVTSYYEAVNALWDNPLVDNNKIVHFCQGIEAEYKEALPFIKGIKRCYSLPLPIWTVGEWLSKKIIKRFSPPVSPYTIGQGIEFDHFFPPDPDSHRRSYISDDTPIKVVFVAPFNISIKEVPFGLRVLRRLKERCKNSVEIIRVSSIDTADEEARIFRADKYLTGLLPLEVGALFRSSHILFSPSNDGEGFGLPVAEAMACSMACCVSSISSYTSWDKKDDYALFFPPHDEDKAFSMLYTLVCNPRLRVQLGKRGREVARQFSFSKVVKRIEKWFDNYYISSKSYTGK